MKQKRIFCRDCDKYVLGRKKQINHILHLIVSIITGGIWLIVWIFLAAFQKPYQCPNCGWGKKEIMIYVLAILTVIIFLIYSYFD